MMDRRKPSRRRRWHWRRHRGSARRSTLSSPSSASASSLVTTSSLRRTSLGQKSESIVSASPADVLIHHPVILAGRFIDKGGDWDRRNRLKVYKGLHLISIRQFNRGGELFLDSLSTFTATELVSYNDFVALTIIANTLTLKRPDLKAKVRLFDRRSLELVTYPLQ